MILVVRRRRHPLFQLLLGLVLLFIWGNVALAYWQVAVPIGAALVGLALLGRSPRREPSVLSPTAVPVRRATAQLDCENTHETALQQPIPASGADPFSEGI